MTREPLRRLKDIAAALDAIRVHMGRGPLTDSLVFDAVRVTRRLASALELHRLPLRPH